MDGHTLLTRQLDHLKSLTCEIQSLMLFQIPAALEYISEGI